MESLGAYRPQRQRKSVSHYSDDNPSTFTVKVKKGFKSDNIDDTSISKHNVEYQQSNSPRKGIKRPHAGLLSTNHDSKSFKAGNLEDSDDDDDNVIIASLVHQDAATNGGLLSPSIPRRGRPPKRTPSAMNKSKKRDSSSSSSGSSSPRGTINSSAPRTKMTMKVSAPKKTSNAPISNKSSSTTASNQIRRRKRVRILTDPTLFRSSIKPHDEMICHTAAIQTVLPVSTVVVNNLRKEYYEGFLSDIIPPRPIVSEWNRLELADDTTLRQTKSTCSSSTSRTTTRQTRPLHWPSKSTPTISTIPFDITATTTKPDAYITAFSRRQHRYCRQSKSNTSLVLDELKEMNEFVVTGDCYGGVALWKVGWGYKLCHLHTAASQREEGRIILSKKVISFPNEVLQTAWSSNDIILVLTESDLEGIKISYDSNFLDETTPGQSQIQKRLFLADLTPSSVGRNVQPSNQFHFHKHSPIVLWSSDERDFVRNCHSFADEERSDNKVSLLCLELGKDDEHDMKTSPIQPDGVLAFRCLAAVWDSYNSQGQFGTTDSLQFILALAQTAPDKLELLRINFSNQDEERSVVSDRCTVSLITGRSLNVAQMECTIQQVPPSSNKYTLLCGTRIAIQIFDSVTLVCLATFGKSVSLHGKTVQWQSCHWLQAPARNVDVGSVHDIHGKTKQQQEWILRKDEIATRSQLKETIKNLELGLSSPLEPSGTATYNDAGFTSSGTFQENTSNYHNFWLIGVPHPEKGPAELNSTLHIWKNPLVGIEGNEFDPLLRHQQLLLQQQLDSTSLFLPPGGSLGICITSAANDFRLLCATAKTGQLYQRNASFRTNFAGVMYPVSYSVIDDNIEYIEDESEMDQSIIIEEAKDDSIEPVAVSAINLNVGPKPRGRPRKTQLASASNYFLGDVDVMDAHEHDALTIVQGSSRADNISSSVQNLPVNVTVDAIERAFLNSIEECLFQVPCWPTPTTTKNVYDHVVISNDVEEIHARSGQSDSDIRRDFKNQFLEHFPMKKHLSHSDHRKQFAEVEMSSENTNGLTTMICGEAYSVCSSSTGTGNYHNGGNNSSATTVAKSFKGKRTRFPNVDAVLQSSVDSSLRILMVRERGRWSNGAVELGGRLHDFLRNVDRGEVNSADADAYHSSSTEIVVSDGEFGNGNQYNQKHMENNNTVSYHQTNGGLCSKLPERNDDQVLTNGGNGLFVANSSNGDGYGNSVDANQIAVYGVFKTSHNGIKREMHTTLASSLTTSDSKPERYILEGGNTAALDNREQQSNRMSQNSDTKQGHNSQIINSTQFTPLVPAEGVNEVIMSTDQTVLKSAKEVARSREGAFGNCAACRGRYVVHSCLKRDNPTGFETARAEKETIERKAAEIARAKAEKSRQAQAKRREAKMCKKQEEEERKKRDDVEMRRIEEAIRRREENERKEAEERQPIERLLKERLEQHAWASTSRGVVTTASTYNEYELAPDARLPPEFAYPNRVPSYRAINNGVSDQPTSSVTVPSSSLGQSTTNVNDHPSATASAETSNQIMRSTPIDRSDALATLAGLAESMPTILDASPEVPNYPYDDSHLKYEYTGSRERQADILLAHRNHEPEYNTGYSEYYEENCEADDQILNQGYGYDRSYVEGSYSGDAADYSDAIIGSVDRQHQSGSPWASDFN